MDEQKIFFLGERIRFAKDKGLPKEMEGHYGTIMGVENGKAIVKDTTYKGSKTFYIEQEQLEHTMTNLYFIDMFEKLASTADNLNTRLGELEKAFAEHTKKKPTVAEIARETGVSRQWVYELRKKLGRMPTVEEIIQQKTSKEV